MTHARVSPRARALSLLSLVALAVTVASASSCDWGDIGLGLPTSPLDTFPPPVVTDPLTWLTANSAAVRSLDFTDTNFSDLEPLRTGIGDSRIVLLGEQSRYDGTTFEAKARLVRFLHEQMGFDVLVFESGVFDVREAWRDVRSGANAVNAARASIDATWSNSSELSALFTYIGARASSARPLALAGIDPQFTGPIGGGTGARFLNELDTYLNRYESPVRSSANWPAFRTVVDRLARRYYDAAPFTQTEQATFAAGVEALMSESNRLVNVAPSDEASFWVTMSLALNAHGRSVALRQQNLSELSAGIRDSSMSNSLVWLAQTVYPGRKIIVWSTATPIMRTPNELYGVAGVAQGHGRAIFGQIARVTLGDVMYSLGFLAGSGAYGPLDPPATTPVRPLVMPLPESWDGLFLATGKPLAFLNLRRVATQENAWIFNRRVARAIGYQQFAANWPAVYDGFFFTASMAPATRAP